MCSFVNNTLWDVHLCQLPNRAHIYAHLCVVEILHVIDSLCKSVRGKESFFLSSGSFKAVFTANTILLFDIKMNRESVCSLIYCLFIWIWNGHFTRCRNFSKCCFKVDMKLKLWYILVKRLLEQEKNVGQDLILSIWELTKLVCYCCHQRRDFAARGSGYFVITLFWLKTKKGLWKKCWIKKRLNKKVHKSLINTAIFPHCNRSINQSINCFRLQFVCFLVIYMLFY